MSESSNPETSSAQDSILKSKRKKKNLKMAAIFLGVAVVVACVLMCLPLLIEKAAHDALIKIPRNATHEMVQDSITKYLDDEYAEKVMKVAKLRGSEFAERYGAYLIEQGMSPLQAEHRLSHGAQEPLTVTINRFRTLENLAKKVAVKLDFSADELIKTLKNDDVLSQYGLSSDQALSLFLEDSYDFYWTASPMAFIQKIGANYNKIWNEERIQKAKDLGLTPAQLMTIASIVDLSLILISD
ncbi:MAG: endolytic transglycosylase MltG, partial [Muribaculaceae bacterium]|nr:endolytic transglycosylase MltG [Muribaculaceae bacterium]